MENSAAARAAEHDMSNAIFAREGDQGGGHGFMFERDDQTAHFLRGFQGICNLALHGRVDAGGRFLGRPNINRIPLRIKLCSQARGLAQKAGGIRSKTADGDHHLTERADSPFRFVGLPLPAVEEIGCFGQGHFAQAGQISLG